MQKMEKRTIVMLSLLVLVVIFFLQNLGNANLQILFIGIKMPKIVFFSLLLGIGFLLGFLFAKKK